MKILRTIATIILLIYLPVMAFYAFHLCYLHGRHYLDDFCLGYAFLAIGWWLQFACQVKFSKVPLQQVAEESVEEEPTKKSGGIHPIGRIVATFNGADGPLFTRDFDGWWFEWDGCTPMLTPPDEVMNKWLGHQRKRGFFDIEGTLYPMANIVSISMERTQIETEPVDI